MALTAVGKKETFASVSGSDDDGAGDANGKAVGMVAEFIEEVSGCFRLFRICVLHRARCLDEIQSGLVETVKGFNLVGVGTRQGILRGDNFDVRELKPHVRDLDILVRGGQFVDRRLHLANNTRLQKLAGLLDTLLLQVCPGNFGMNPPASEQWNVEADLIRVRGNAIVEARSLVK